jgi:hypothetical protein
MSVSPFFHRIGCTLSQMSASLIHGRGRRAEAHWDLKFSDIIRIGVVHPWRYVATVNAIELRHNIFVAARTVIHIRTPCFSLHFILNRMGSNLFVFPTEALLPIARCVARPVPILRAGIGTVPQPNRNQPGSVSVPNFRRP